MGISCSSCPFCINVKISFQILPIKIFQTLVFLKQFWLNPTESPVKDTLCWVKGHVRLSLFPLSPCLNAHHRTVFRDYNSFFLHPSRCPWIPTPPWTPTRRWSGSPACHRATGRCSPTSRSWNCPPTPSGSFLEHGKKRWKSHQHSSVLF